MEPGIYLDLPEADYHKVLALSATGIKWLRVSTLDWWVRSPLNPDYAEEPETEAMRIGKAYHCRTVEGSSAFNARYAAMLDPADYPTALRTNEELIAAIDRHGYRMPKATRKDELIATLRRLDPTAPVWQDVAVAHAEQHAGKILLPADLIRRTEIAASFIERHPDLARAFRDGHPEVSIFWNDPATGTPMKGRLDYLKPRAIVDLKSFTNPYGQPFDRAVTRAIANYRYHIQAAMYLEGMRVLEPEVERTWLWVFQQQGIAPVARGYLCPQILLDIGQQEIAQACATWKHCMDIYGTDPWVDVSEIRELDATEVPAYVAE